MPWAVATHWNAWSSRDRRCLIMARGISIPGRSPVSSTAIRAITPVIAHPALRWTALVESKRQICYTVCLAVALSDLLRALQAQQTSQLLGNCSSTCNCRRVAGDHVTAAAPKTPPPPPHSATSPIRERSQRKHPPRASPRCLHPTLVPGSRRAPVDSPLLTFPLSSSSNFSSGNLQQISGQDAEAAVQLVPSMRNSRQPSLSSSPWAPLLLIHPREKGSGTEMRLYTPKRIARPARLSWSSMPWKTNGTSRTKKRKRPLAGPRTELVNFVS